MYPATPRDTPYPAVAGSRNRPAARRRCVRIERDAACDMACVPLIAAGGGVQIVGFALALRQSVRMRRERTPNDASLARWTATWIRRTGGQTATWVRVKSEPLLVRLHLRRPRTVSASVSVSGGGRMDAKVSAVTRRSGSPLPTRVELLEKDVDGLRQQQSEDRLHLERRIEEVRSGIESQRAQQESERARQLGRSLRYEELGVLVFVIGVGLTTAGAIA
jgi:hypothetical protein